MFCFATDPYKTTYTMTKALIAAMGGKGNIVHLTGLLIDTNTTLREQAVQKAVDETNGAVKLLQTVADTDAEEAGDQKINALLAAQKDQIDGIIGTAHITSEVAAKALRAIGDKRIKYIAFDDSPAVLAAVKDGFAQATFVQNPYGQAYIGAYRARPPRQRRVQDESRRSLDQDAADRALHRFRRARGDARQAWHLQGRR